MACTQIPTLKKTFVLICYLFHKEENRLTILKPQNFTSSSIRSQQDEHNAIFYPTNNSFRVHISIAVIAIF